MSSPSITRQTEKPRACIYAAILAPACLALALTLLSAAAASAAKPDLAKPNLDKRSAKNVQALLVKQESKMLSNTDVYITAKAIKIVEVKSGTQFVACAPDWKVFVFNNRSKQIYCCSLDQFKGYSKSSLFVQVGYDYTGIPVQPTAKHGKLFGFTTHIYESSLAYGQQAEKQCGKHSPNPQPGATKSASLDASNLGLGSVAPQALLLSRYYILHDVNEIPLNYRATDMIGNHNKPVETKSITTVALPPSEFKPPTDYKSVSEVEKVRIDNSAKESMESVLMGIDEHLEKKQKK